MSRWLARLAAAGLLAGAGALLAGLAAVVVWGRDYYLLTPALRDEHRLHDVLGAGAPVGVLLGVVGTVLMVSMLSYTLRKKLPRARWLGPLPLWLLFHVLCGITGPLFILVHAGLTWPSGLIAVGFWCMVLVALSGVFGRYVYGFLPRVASGRALAWDEAMASLADLRAELVSATAGSTSHAIGEAVALARDFDTEARTLPDLLRLDREARRRRRAIHATLAEADLDRDALTRARAALDAQLRLRRSLEASRVAYRMFRYWHLFHRPLAAAMYVIVGLHVLGAVVIGGSLAQLLTLVDP